VKKCIVMLIVAGAFAASGAFAAEEKSRTDLESRLEAARARLEQAAHEVAELSAEVGKPVMDRFMMLGEGPRRAIIGVQLDPGSGKDGAKVKDVSPGGPAAEAGIKPQDVIVMVNGAEVKGDSVREVTSIMRKVEPESKVKVRVLRNGKPQDFTVAARPAVGMFTRALPAPPPPPGFPGHDMAFEFREGPMGFFDRFLGEFSDMELANLTPQLGRYFGTNEGVLVVRKPEGDDTLKLEDGDVILSIDGRKPTSGSHATRILNSYQPGEKITLRVMRQKKLINLDVTMPERPGHREVKIMRAGEEPT
jgi:C-terminal processing protease CtpA/Prc